jgi:hypothetical protein
MVSTPLAAIWDCDVVAYPYQISRDLQLLDSTCFNKRLFHGSGAVGGAYIVDVNKYLAIGGENENFYGWGRKMPKEKNG